MFSIDWNKWRAEWAHWKAEEGDEILGQAVSGSTPFSGSSNLLCDEKLGVFSVGGRLVELSEVTMPDFGVRPRRDLRFIGGTVDRPGTGETFLVDSFDELVTELRKIANA